jgi:hypothetical protein
MLLGPARVPVPEVDEGDWPTGDAAGTEPGETVLDRLRRACGDRHDLWVREVALEEYAASGLPATTMGRPLDQDRLFFAAALAAGDALGAMARQDSVS